MVRIRTLLLVCACPYIKLELELVYLNIGKRDKTKLEW